MRGAVVVGEGGKEVTTMTPLGMVLGGGLTATVLGFLGLGVYLHVKDTTEYVRVSPPSSPDPGVR